MTSKLIRITTTDSNGVFDSQYDDDIVLEPNSEIALQSVAFKTGEILQVDSNDNAIEFSVGGSSHTAFLTTGTFSVANIRDLLTDMQNKMNRQSLLSNSKEFGLQYKVYVNKDDKVEFMALQDPMVGQPMLSMSSSLTADLGNQVEYFNVDKPTSATDVLVASTDPSPVVINLNHSLAYSIVPFTKACGVHRMRIADMADGAQNGFCIGLTKNISALRNQVLADADVECAINITDKSQFYNVKTTALGPYAPSTKGPNKVTDSPNSDGNDVIELAMEAGVVKLRVHTNQSGGTTFELGSYSYDFDLNSDLYPFISLFRDDSLIAVDQCNHTVDPYIQRNPTNQVGGKTHVHTGLSVVNIPDGNSVVRFKASSNHSLLFNALGFSTNIFYDIVASELRNIAIGNSRTFTIVSANNYLIELLNFPIESYDSFDDYNSAGSKRGRSNIIATVPINESTGAVALGIVQYEPNNIHYISLSNRERRLFRNVRARIVNDDYSAIDTFGMSAITLLLKNK